MSKADKRLGGAGSDLLITIVVGRFDRRGFENRRGSTLPTQGRPEFEHFALGAVLHASQRRFALE